VHVDSRGGFVCVINDGDGEVKGVGNLRKFRLARYLSEMRGLERF